MGWGSEEKAVAPSPGNLVTREKTISLTKHSSLAYSVWKVALSGSQNSLSHDVLALVFLL